MVFVLKIDYNLIVFFNVNRISYTSVINNKKVMNLIIMQCNKREVNIIIYWNKY